MIYAKYIVGLIIIALSAILYGSFKDAEELGHFWLGNIGQITTWCVSVWVVFELAPKKNEYCEVCKVELSSKCVDCDVE